MLSVEVTCGDKVSPLLRRQSAREQQDLGGAGVDLAGGLHKVHALAVDR